MSYKGNVKGSYGIKKAQRIHARRSLMAKRIDEGLRAPLAESPEQWIQQPNRFGILRLTHQKEKQLKEKKA